MKANKSPKKGKSFRRIAPLDQLEQLEQNERIQKAEQKSKSQEGPRAQIADPKLLTLPVKPSRATDASESSSRAYDLKGNDDPDDYDELEDDEYGKGPNDDDDEESDEVRVYDDVARPRWYSDIDFLLSIIGFAVDISNVWSFPYRCVTHGGAMFLIPYTVILVTCGIPIFYMELIIGQYVKQGCISVWKICPLFKGVGICMCIVSYGVTFFYNVILAWSVVYMYESTASPLKWTQCGDKDDDYDAWWATSNCTSALGLDRESNNTDFPTSSKEFFDGRVLHLYDKVRSQTVKHDIENLGHPDDKLAAILLGCYSILLLVLIFGIRVTGKVVWVTATLPYLILGILLFRGITLPGSREGLIYFLQPNATAITKIEAWSEAALQVFFSLGPGFGIHLTLASFNRFHHNLLSDCIITAVVNALTSVLAGFVIFSFLGNMAYALRSQIEDISQMTNGLELVFIVFPLAVGRLPGSNFFSFIFFLMIFVIGIDTVMSGIQSIQVGIIDNFQDVFNRHAHSREVFMFVLLISSFLVSLTCVTQGGIFVFQLLYEYVATVSLLFAVLLLCVGIGWIYGTQNLCAAVETMTGKYPSAFFIVCWKFVAPAFLTTLLTFLIVQVYQAEVGYGKDDMNNDIKLPLIFRYIGIGIACVPSVVVPITALFVICNMKTSSLYSNKFILAISPEHEHAEILATGIAARASIAHYCWCKCSKPTPVVEPEDTTPFINPILRKELVYPETKDAATNDEDDDVAEVTAV